jgi:multiple sugar transport system permease protein
MFIRYTKKILFYLLVALILTFCLSPYLWQFITSVKQNNEISSLPPIFPTTIDLVHYINVFKKDSFIKIIFNSFVVASFTTIFCLIIGSISAYSIAKLKIKGKNIFLALVLSISMFPPIAIVSPLYIIIREFGLRDTYIALIFPYMTFTLPLTIWILTNFFKTIPDDLSDASKIDGCSPFQTFYKVFLPLSLPGIFTCAILIFIFSWNEFLFALTFTITEKSRTIPVEIALFPGLHEIPWGDIASATIIVTIPLIILVLVFQKRILSGLLSGSIKG